MAYLFLDFSRKDRRGGKENQIYKFMVPQLYVPQEGLCGQFLGAGQQGSVLSAYNQETGTEVALKQIKTQLQRAPNESADSFNQRKQYYFQIIRREWHLLEAVAHPNIVDYKDQFFDEPAGLFYLVMEKMEESLDDIIKHGQLQSNLIYTGFFLQQLLQAVEYLENYPIIHRDIKPGNIGVNRLKTNDKGKRELTFKLYDLGFSRICNKDTSVHTKCRGTPYYMAPELLFGRKYDCKVDVWAVFVTGCQLLTGKHMFAPCQEDLENLPADRRAKAQAEIGSQSESVVKRKMLTVCGTTTDSLPHSEVGYNIRFEFKKTDRLPIQKWLHAPIQGEHGNCNKANFFSLLEQVFVFNPDVEPRAQDTASAAIPPMRPSAHQCLKHALFTGLETLFCTEYHTNLAVEPDFEAIFKREVAFANGARENTDQLFR